MTDDMVDLQIVEVDALLNDAEEVTATLEGVVQVVKQRLRMAKGGVRPQGKYQLVVDNCEALQMGGADARRRNGAAVEAIALFGRSANVQVLLRSAEPSWIKAYDGTILGLKLKVIGDARLSDMIVANAQSGTEPVYPSIAFEEMP
jgi:hypothetical protein